MEQILSLINKERAQYFQQAAAKSEKIKNPIIFEKDFWVCWTLQQIFSMPEINSHITFKGGTSLSKCYDVINRFSEDCDLTLSKQFLAINDDTEAVSIGSKNQKIKKSNALGEAVKNKVNDHILPWLIDKFKSVLDKYFQSSEWSIEIDATDAQNLLFHYPTTNQSNKEYIQSIVKLEFGGRGDNNPSEVKTITPFVYQILSDAFETVPSIPIPTLTAQRTFWEKVTLLHAEHHRNVDKPPKARMFRHYYDITMLHQKGITQLALKDPQLLKTVITNKKAYFYTAWASYDTAKIGTIKLLPNGVFTNTLKNDFENMSDMFFGEKPDFDIVMMELAKIEKIINSEFSSS